MIKAALVERTAGIVSEVTCLTDAELGPAAVLDRIAEVVRQLQSLAPSHALEGVGIGAPGAINWERTAVLYPPNLPGWGVVDLCAELRARLGTTTRVFVENDANLAGLGSAFYSAGRPFDSFIMVTLGTGVGGAIIYRNRIFRGTTGAAGEIGHLSIDYDGPLDRHGIAGAIEAYLGQRFLSRYARYRLLNRTDSVVHQMARPDLGDLTPLMLFRAAERGDEAAIEVLAWAGHKLGCALASAINLLDIRKVVVGGGVSAAGAFILEPARKAVLAHLMPGSREGVELIQETLGNQVGMLGAARLVFEYLDEQTPLPGSAPSLA
jgi:glucokinase